MPQQTPSGFFFHIFFSAGVDKARKIWKARKTWNYEIPLRGLADSNHGTCSHFCKNVACAAFGNYVKKNDLVSVSGSPNGYAGDFY